MFKLFLLVFCFFIVSCVAKRDSAPEPSWTQRDIVLPDDDEIDEDDIPEAGEDDTGTR